MLVDEDRHGGTAEPNSLIFSQAQVNHILGYSLAKLHQDLMKAPIPEKLQALLDQIEAVTATGSPKPADPSA